jgi:DnaA family protein
VQQLALELAPPPEPTFDSFFPARNAAAQAVLLHAVHACGQAKEARPEAVPTPAQGAERFIYLWGPPGSGKSHLLHAFVAESARQGGVARYFRAGESIDSGDGDLQAAIDDVDGLDMVGQLALFDLYNRIRTGSGTLVTAGTRPPAELPLREDLRTRLGAGVVMRLEPLTDEEKAAALSEHGRRRGLALSPELIEYLLTHVTRDMGTQMAVVATLDRVSLERKRPLTLPLLREVLRLLAQRPAPLAR